MRLGISPFQSAIREIMVLNRGTEVELNLENSKIIIKIKKESGGYSERFFKCAYKNTKSWPSINQKIFGWTVNVQ